LFTAEQHIKLDLYGLGRRCLGEPASRRLDDEIYCALHNIIDRNPLINDQLLQAREDGEVLVEHGPGDGLAWIEVPAFTAELMFAESLLPGGLFTLYRDAQRVRATTLQARALANEPPVGFQLRQVASGLSGSRTLHRAGQIGPPTSAASATCWQRSNCELIVRQAV
jgi:hypothetical protein